MAIFSNPSADIGDWQCAALEPSKEAATNGYWLLSGVNNTSAPFSVCSSTLLFITIGPVNHRPAEINTVPPPALLQAKIALLIAVVFKKIPLFSAPYSLILKVSFLKSGW